MDGVSRRASRGGEGPLPRSVARPPPGTWPLSPTRPGATRWLEQASSDSDRPPVVPAWKVPAWGGRRGGGETDRWWPACGVSFLMRFARAAPWLFGAVYALLFVAWPLAAALIVVGAAVGALAWRAGPTCDAVYRWRWIGQDADGEFWLSAAALPRPNSRVAVAVDDSTRDSRFGLWLVLRQVNADALYRDGGPDLVRLWLPAARAADDRESSLAARRDVENETLRALRVRLRWARPEAQTDARPVKRALDWTRRVMARTSARIRHLMAERKVRGSELTGKSGGRREGGCPMKGQDDAASAIPAVKLWPRGRQADLITDAHSDGVGAGHSTDEFALNAMRDADRGADVNDFPTGGADDRDPRVLSPELAALLSDDPDHIYDDDELDAIEAIDAELALRLDRAQTFARRAEGNVHADGPIDEAEIRAAIDEARRILAQDGGDIEFVRLEGRVAMVRLKGACVGCPRSTLDLKNVVERLVRARVPGVERVANVF